MKIEDIKVGQIVIDKDCERLGKLIISEIDKNDKVFVRTLDGAEEYYHYCVFNIASLIEVGIDDKLFSSSIKKDTQTLKEQLEEKEITISKLRKKIKNLKRASEELRKDTMGSWDDAFTHQ